MSILVFRCMDSSNWCVNHNYWIYLNTHLKWGINYPLRWGPQNYIVLFARKKKLNYYMILKQATMKFSISKLRLREYRIALLPLESITPWGEPSILIFQIYYLYAFVFTRLALLFANITFSRSKIYTLNLIGIIKICHNFNYYL